MARINHIDEDDLTYEEKVIKRLKDENSRLKSKLELKSNKQLNKKQMQVLDMQWKIEDLERQLKYANSQIDQLQHKLDILKAEKEILPIDSETAGIYRIYNKFTNESYIGQSVNVYNRIKEHYNAYYSDPDDWHYDLVQNPQDYEWEVLEEGIKYHSTLDRKEVYYIGKYDAIDHGYNKKLGGQGAVYLT